MAGLNRCTSQMSEFWLWPGLGIVPSIASDHTILFSCQILYLLNGPEMWTATPNEACPKCRGRTLYQIRRDFWMRLIPMSRNYLCHHCRHQFISLPPDLPYLLGILFFLLGIGVLVSVVSSVSIGIGHSGFSPLERMGTLIGVLLVFVGFFITVLPLIKRLAKFDKGSDTHN